MIFKGFRFGMLLQIAIGPVCMYVIKTANESGVWPAEAAVFAATLADVIFVSLALLGVGALLERRGVQMVLKIAGTLVLLFFGVGIVLGTLGAEIIPSFGGGSTTGTASVSFATSFLLTLSSPLSILFWTGVFASKVSDEGFGRLQMRQFGAGAVLATLVFLGVVALVFGIFHLFISSVIVDILNIFVGLILIGFAFRMALRKKTVQKEGV